MKKLLLIFLLLASQMWAAVASSELASADLDADQTSFATASVSPTANRLVLACFHCWNATEVPGDATLSGASMTWVSVNTKPFHTIASPLRKLYVFRSLSASPGSGALTIDFGAQTNGYCAWKVVEFSGVDTSGTNGSGAVVQSATEDNDNTNTTEVTLSAFGSTNNATFGFFGLANNTTFAAGSGFSEVGADINEAAPDSVTGAEFLAGNDTGVDCSWGASTRNAGIAVEIKAGGSAVPVLLQNNRRRRD